MSIVVAVKKNGQTVMAADSLNVFGQERIPSDNVKTVKILRTGTALMAVTGWSVYANILEDMLADTKAPSLRDEKEIFSFFMEMWRALHERYPFVNDQAHSKDSPFGDLDAVFLVANKTGIYRIGEDSNVCRFDKYCAIGSGGNYARAAARAYLAAGWDDPGKIVRESLTIAADVCIYTNHKIEVLES